MTLEVAGDLTSELTHDPSTRNSCYPLMAKEIGELEDPFDRILETHGLLNKAFEASVPRRVRVALQYIQDNEGVYRIQLSDFLKKLSGLFEDNFLGREHALKHRRRWAQRDASARVEYLLDLVDCVNQDPHGNDAEMVVSADERAYLKELYQSERWSDSKGKNAIV
jgi:hypothetical protein